jgi:hypothetical protein
MSEVAGGHTDLKCHEMELEGIGRGFSGVLQCDIHGGQKSEEASEFPLTFPLLMLTFITVLI